MRLPVLAFVTLVLAIVSPTNAPAVTIGSPGSQNCIPFGCDRSGPSTRYQQVYAAGEFEGPITITAIEFPMTVHVGGSLASGTYSLFLSTTAAGPGTLSPTPNLNVGADQQFFVTRVLSGESAPTVLRFDGAPFDYEPSAGNLLLDIQVSNFSSPPCFDVNSGCSFYDASLSPGVFSRATDFVGTGGGPFYTDNVGLVTTFVPEPGAGLLVMMGLVGLAAHRKRYAKAL